MTNRTLLSCIFITLLFLPVQAQSEDWLNYYEGNAGDMAYIDMHSMRYMSVNDIRILKKVEPGGLSRTALILSEIVMDCENSMIRYLKETTYFKDGSSSSDAKYEKFRKVTIEDDDESLMELICSLKKKK